MALGAVDGSFGRAEEEQRAPFLLFAQGIGIPGQVAVPGRISENQLTFKGGDGPGDPVRGNADAAAGGAKNSGKLVPIGGNFLDPTGE